MTSFVVYHSSGAAPSHMDFNIDIYSQYLDGRCIGNNYFTLQDYVSATLDFFIILKGVVTIGGYSNLDGLTKVDYHILTGALRKAIQGNEYVDVKYHIKSHYGEKQLAFDMYIPTSVYRLDPRKHGSVNATYETAKKYLIQATSEHLMSKLVFDGAADYSLSGSTSTFDTIPSVDISDISFGSYVVKQLEESSKEDFGGSGSRGGTDEVDDDGRVSFMTDGHEKTPTLSQTLLSYANFKMSAIAFFALSIMAYFISKYRAVSIDDDTSSLLDASSSSLLRNESSSRKSKKRAISSRNEKRSGRSDNNEGDYIMVPSSVDLEKDEYDSLSYEGDMCDVVIKERQKSKKSKSRKVKDKRKSREAGRK